MYRFTASATVTALAAAAEEDLTFTEAQASKAKVGDVIAVNTLSAPETGLAILAAWVDSPGVIKVRVGNVSGSSLTGGATNFRICVLR